MHLSRNMCPDQANMSDLGTRQSSPAQICHKGDAALVQLPLCHHASIFVCRLTSKFPFPADIIARIAELPPPSLTQVSKRGHKLRLESDTGPSSGLKEGWADVGRPDLPVSLALRLCDFSASALDTASPPRSLFLRQRSAIFQRALITRVILGDCSNNIASHNQTNLHDQHNRQIYLRC